MLIKKVSDATFLSLHALPKMLRISERQSVRRTKAYGFPPFRRSCRQSRNTVKGLRPLENPGFFNSLKWEITAFLLIKKISKEYKHCKIKPMLYII